MLLQDFAGVIPFNRKRQNTEFWLILLIMLHIL